MGKIDAEKVKSDEAVEETEDKPTCFVIMPVSNRSNLKEIYSEDENYFSKIYNYLLKPAIEKGGFIPIPPIVEGAPIIQKRIIDNLRESNLVLCDMSAYNSNVFFELGIRTAFNKPICLIRDKHTPEIPFDVNMINAKEYTSTLLVDEVNEQIPGLADHIKSSYKPDKDGQGNELWKNLAMEITAESYKNINSADLVKRIMALLEGELSRKSSSTQETKLCKLANEKLILIKADGAFENIINMISGLVIKGYVSSYRVLFKGGSFSEIYVTAVKNIGQGTIAELGGKYFLSNITLKYC